MATENHIVGFILCMTAWLHVYGVLVIVIYILLLGEHGTSSYEVRTDQPTLSGT